MILKQNQNEEIWTQGKTTIAFLNKWPAVFEVIPSFKFEVKIPQACHLPSSRIKSNIDPWSMLMRPFSSERGFITIFVWKRTFSLLRISLQLSETNNFDIIHRFSKLTVRPPLLFTYNRRKKEKRSRENEAQKIGSRNEREKSGPSNSYVDRGS